VPFGIQLCIAKNILLCLQQNLSQYWEHQYPMNSTSHNPWRKEKDNHTHIYIKIIFIVCRNKQSRIKGEERPRPFPPDAARGWERVGKNKGELSGLRRANRDAVDNETSAHD